MLPNNINSHFVHLRVMPQVNNFLQASSSMAATMARFFGGVKDSPRANKRRVVQKWPAARSKIEAQAAAQGTASLRVVRRSGSSQVIPPHVEALLVKRVNDLRRDSMPVSDRMVEDQAIDLGEEAGIEDGLFTASWQWRRSFMSRHRLLPYQDTSRPRDSSGRLRSRGSLCAANC